jgi:hypothetical protein
MQTIRRCGSIQEALRVRLFLDSVGIESFIPDEVSSMIAPNEFFNAPGVRVQVKPEDLNEASAALAEFR